MPSISEIEREKHRPRTMHFRHDKNDSDENRKRWLEQHDTYLRMYWRRENLKSETGEFVCVWDDDTLARKHTVHMKSANICFDMFLCCWRRLLSHCAVVWVYSVHTYRIPNRHSRESEQIERACERGVQCFVRAYSNSSSMIARNVRETSCIHTTLSHTHGQRQRERDSHARCTQRRPRAINKYTYIRTHSTVWCSVWDTQHTDTHSSAHSTARRVRKSG